MAYGNKVLDHYENPRNVGTLDKSDPNVGTGLVGAPACGDVMRLQIKVSDDGRGIDTAKVKARAIERGLLQPGQETTEEGLMEVLFLPGFSTAEAVSELSGRGVGLDVVRKAITELKGQITVDSRPGEGTTVRVRFPIPALAAAPSAESRRV